MTDNEKLEHFITCLRAYNEGKKVEHKRADGVLHFDFGLCSFCDFDPETWRVKPDAPKVVPWTFATAPPILKARLKGGNEHNVVLSLRGNDGFLALSEEFGGKFVNFPTAANLYEQLDGSCCGIEQKEESEWPKWAVDKVGDIWKAVNDRECMLYRKGNDFTPAYPQYIGSWHGFLQGDLNPTSITEATAQAIIANAKEAK